MTVASDDVHVFAARSDEDDDTARLGTDDRSLEAAQ